MSVVFLLGSGASNGAGTPTVRDITRAVCEGTTVQLHSDGRHYLADPQPPSLGQAGPEVQRAVAVVRCVLPLIRRQMGGRPNYEEIYFLLRQIVDHELWDFENPALLPLVGAMKKRLAESSWGINLAGEVLSLKDVAASACDYIHDVAWRLLQQGRSHEHMGVWAVAIRELGSECAAVVSLNHDELARHALEATGLEVADGFDPPGPIRPWRPSQLEEAAATRLIHLHGALSWFWYVREDDSKRRQCLLRVEGGDIDRVLSRDNVQMVLADNRPCLSIGTHNKVTSYFRQPFNELYGQLTRVLREEGTVDRIVLAGYGGADKGVNLQVSDWMQAGDHRRLVLVHPRPAEWLAAARPHLAMQWPDWQGAGRTSTLEKRFEAVTREEWIAAARG